MITYYKNIRDVRKHMAYENPRLVAFLGALYVATGWRGFSYIAWRLR